MEWNREEARRVWEFIAAAKEVSVEPGSKRNWATLFLSEATAKKIAPAVVAIQQGPAIREELQAMAEAPTTMAAVAGPQAADEAPADPTADLSPDAQQVWDDLGVSRRELTSAFQVLRCVTLRAGSEARVTKPHADGGVVLFPGDLVRIGAELSETSVRVRTQRMTSICTLPRSILAAVETDVDA